MPAHASDHAPTPREREVLALTREGESAWVIARRLEMPVRAVQAIVRAEARRRRT